MFRLYPIHPSLLQQLFVDLLQLQRSQFPQRNPADIRLDVVVNVSPVGLVGGGPDLDLGVIFESLVHPLAHRVLLRFHTIDIFRCFHGRFQLRPGLRLRPAKHIPIDGPSRLRVVTGGVPPLPSAVLPFSDIAFSIGPSFCHAAYFLRSNTQYRGTQ